MVRKQTLDTLGVAAARMLDDGTLHQVIPVSEKSAKRPFLRFMMGGSEVGRLEYGRNESVGVIFYKDDPSLVRVMVHPSRSNSSTGDYVFSDGTNPELLQIEFETGRQVFRTTAKYQNGPPMFRSSNAAVSMVNGKRSLITAGRSLDSGESSQMIMGLVMDEDVIIANDERIVTVDGPYSFRLVSIHGPEGGTPLTATTVQLDYADYVVADDREENLYFSTPIDGRLMKLDLDSLQVDEIRSARPWHREAGWLALACWIAFTVMWFWTSRSSESPLVDCSLFLIVLLAGCLISVHFAAPTAIWRGLRCLALAIAFSMVALLCLGWRNQRERQWLASLSLGVVPVALCYRDDLVGDLLLGGFWVFWYVCGCVVVSVVFSRSKLSKDTLSLTNTFSLWQIIAATGVFAALLAAVRIYVMADSEQTTQEHFTWLLSAPMATALITVTAQYGGSRIRYLWLAFITSVGVIASSLTLLVRMTGGNNFAATPNRLEWGVVTVLSGLLIFVLSRHLRYRAEQHFEPAVQ